MKRRLVTAMQRYAANPAARLIMGRLPGTALLETVGRKSGKPRTTPVGGKLESNTFWFVSEQGRHSQYVRNIQANPSVRLRVGGRWRSGTATLHADDDPRRRLRSLGWSNGLFVRLLGTDLLSISIDLTHEEE